MEAWKDCQGYFREPTIWHKSLVFVCEDDLWFSFLEGVSFSAPDVHLSHFSPGGMPEKLAVGPGNFVSFGPLGGGARQNPPRVLQRHGYGYPTWKRGGTAGEIWVDAHGTWRFFKAPFLDQQHTPAFVDRKSDLLPIGP